MKTYTRVIVLLFIFVNIFNITVYSIKYDHILVFSTSVTTILILMLRDPLECTEIVYEDIITIYKETIKIIKFYLNI